MLLAVVTAQIRCPEGDTNGLTLIQVNIGEGKSSIIVPMVLDTRLSILDGSWAIGRTLDKSIGFS
jgi:hypothetical protein